MIDIEKRRKRWLTYKSNNVLIEPQAGLDVLDELQDARETIAHYEAKAIVSMEAANKSFDKIARQAEELERKENLLERIRVRAYWTGWNQNLTDCLSAEINKAPMETHEEWRAQQKEGEE